MKTSRIILLTAVCVILTGVGVYLLGGLDRERLQLWLESMGFWAPLVYALFYTLGTLLILPSTPLNLCGGAIFGVWWGTLWTSLAAIVAAVVGFAFTRTVGRDWVAQKLAGRWEAVDAEICQGGFFYIFAIRLLPIIPYGIVNLAAGLTSIRFRDYLLGTFLGTIPGILPFILMGSSLQALSRGDLFPLLLALALTGILFGAATWYRRRRRDPRKALAETEKKRKAT